MVKPELRILGVDDSPFIKTKKGKVLVVCTVFRGNRSLDGLISFKVIKDGFDSTVKLIKAVNGSKHKKQLNVIMINGVALGGFNIIDLFELNNKTRLPVIAIIRHKPDLAKIKFALSNLSSSSKRWSLIEQLPPVSSLRTNDGLVYYQSIGLSKQKAESIIKLSILRGKIPEPIRVAHLIAGGIVSGESRGRA